MNLKEKQPTDNDETTSIKVRNATLTLIIIVTNFTVFTIKIIIISQNRP